MAFSILIFIYRKAGVTPEDFRTHCQTKLVPLHKEIAGEHYALSHTAHYIQRTEGPKVDGNTKRNPTTPATVFMGTQADADWEAIAILEFRDQAHFQAYLGLMMVPENAARIAETEGVVIDNSKTTIVAVGATEVNKKD
ncbi:hypothetical protein B0H66DRAFT_563190 [Apodospora peruviana]|uniref:EthD domain-containing protein n=1 Tax=Apodospora peruviana TaxID=516989 RepID=A0AAE0M0H7_9PEZI|nr:hypothetical protein B0H66DRAFT_563190 [Apodospora peruviana]